MGDFSGGPVVKNPSSNAGDVGSIPGWGTKIPHAAGQLSPLATITELVHLNERARRLQTTEPMSSGTRAPQLEREARMPQLERSLHATMKSPHHISRSRVPQLRPDAAKKKVDWKLSVLKRKRKERSEKKSKEALRKHRQYLELEETEKRSKKKV